MSLTRARRRLLGAVAIAVVGVPLVGAAVLPHVGSEVSTAFGARGVGDGPFPVVLVAGLASDGSGFDRLADELEADGATVLDLDPGRPGRQPFTFRPATRDDDVATIAVEQLGPAIDAALARSGFDDPGSQRIDVVAHSFGGLLARWLVEIEGWGQRVDDLVLVATPHDGTELGFRLATLGSGHEEWDGVGGDIRPSSATLRRLADHEPSGATYLTIGGDPVVFRWLRFGGHGFDGTVPAESALLPGAAQYLFPFTHGRLLRSGRVVALVRRTLRASAAAP